MNRKCIMKSVKEKLFYKLCYELGNQFRKFNGTALEKKIDFALYAKLDNFDDKFDDPDNQLCYQLLYQLGFQVQRLLNDQFKEIR